MAVRRPVRGAARPGVAAPQFKLDLPKPEDSGPMNTKLESKAQDAEHIFIELDAGLVSPAIQIGGTGANSMGTFPGTGADPFATDDSNKKFFKVDNSTLYVFVGDQTEAPVEPLASFGSTSSEDLMSITSDVATPSMDVQLKSVQGEVQHEGIRFEDLELGGIIGSGQQGTVFKAKHQGRQYAVKRISVAETVNSTHSIDRHARKAAIVRELKMVAQRSLRSEYTVALHNAYFKKQELLILMEYMSSSLEEVVKWISRVPYKAVKQTMQKAFGNSLSGNAVKVPVTTLTFPTHPGCSYATPVPELVISLLAHDVLYGLQHLHERMRVVHTDLKPGNILLSCNEHTFKLADFGCSLELDSTNRVPFNGVNLGTKLYMSPERVRAVYSGGGDAETWFDAKSDIWSLGIMVMEMAAGCHPCEGIRSEFWNFSDKLKMDNLVKPESCTSLLWSFTELCLEPDPARRKSASELMNHEFIMKYKNISRKKFANFVAQLKIEAHRHHRNIQQAKIQDKLTRATKTQDKNWTKKSQQAWAVYNRAIAAKAPSVDDKDSFPSL